MQLLRYSWPHYMPLAKLDAFRLTEAMVSSSLGLTSTVRGSNLGGWGARFSVPIQTDPGAHPVSCTMGTGSFPGVRRPGSGVDHPPWSSTEVKGSAELYLYPPPSGSSWPVLKWNLHLSEFLLSCLLYILGLTNPRALTNYCFGSCQIAVALDIFVRQWK